MELSEADTFRAHFRATLKLLCGVVPWGQIKAWVQEKQHELDSSSVAIVSADGGGQGATRRPRRSPRIPETPAAVQRGETGKGAGKKGGGPFWTHHKHQNRNRGKGAYDRAADSSKGRQGGKGGSSEKGRNRWTDDVRNGSVRITPAQRMPLFDST